MSLLAACASVVTVVPSFGQDHHDHQAKQGHDERVYAAAGMQWTMQPFEPTHTGPYDFGPGGSAFAWMANLGVMLTPNVGIDVEGASTGMIRGQGGARSYYTQSVERRDQFFGVNLRLVAKGRGWSVEPVVGAFLVRHTGWTQTTKNVYAGPGQFERRAEPPHEDTFPVSVAISTGLDARLGTGRVTVVPVARFRYRVTNTKILGNYAYGAPLVTLSTGLLARVTF